MSEPALRIALIGLGDIAVRAHLPALAREQRVAVVAVADLEEERLANRRPRERAERRTSRPCSPIPRSTPS